VLLIVFGLLVLLRFPDRPGGKITWQTVEVSSASAGLPLIVLGLVAIFAAGYNLPPRPGPPIPGPKDATPSVALTAQIDATPAVAPTVHTDGSSTVALILDSTPCLGSFFNAETNVASGRVKPVETGASDLYLFGPDDPVEEPIGLILTDRGKLLGAIKFHFVKDNDQFDSDGIVDAQCVPLRNDQYFDETKPDEPAGFLRDLDSWDLELGQRHYELRLSDGGGVEVNRFAALPPD
jgi:hypothetical protein